MALTATSRGTGTNNVSSTTKTVSPTSNLTGGNVAVLCVSYDNAGASGTDPLSSVTDSVGNKYIFNTGTARTPGAAANDGIVGRLITVVMDVAPITTGTVITLNFGAVSVVAFAWAMYEVAAADGLFGEEFDEASVGQTSATPSITTNSIGSGGLVVACVAREANGTRTADGDATNGTWTNAQNTGVGTTTAGAEIICETKVVTGTATQTYNPTFGGASADGVNMWLYKSEIARAYVTRKPFIYPQLISDEVT